MDKIINTSNARVTEIKQVNHSEPIRSAVRVYPTQFGSTVALQIHARSGLDYGHKLRNLIAHAELREHEIVELIANLQQALAENFPK